MLCATSVVMSALRCDTFGAVRELTVSMAASGKSASGLAEHHHGNGRLGQHLLRFAAQEQVAQAAPALRGHEDDVARALLGGLDDFCCRGERLDDDGFAGEVPLLRHLLDL